MTSSSPNSGPTFIVADDHPLFRAALCQALALNYPGSTIHEATDMMSLQKISQQHSDADLLLLDLHMPGAHGFSGLIFINGQYPQLPIMVVSANEKPEIMSRAIDYGAAGFLPKSSSPDTITQAINQVLNGEIWLSDELSTQLANHRREDVASIQSTAEVIASLTPQQFRVATMLAAGLLNKQIAYEMEVTEATVKAHLTALFKKLQVNSRTQAVLAISKLNVEVPDDLNVDSNSTPAAADPLQDAGAITPPQ